MAQTYKMVVSNLRIKKEIVLGPSFNDLSETFLGIRMAVCAPCNAAPPAALMTSLLAVVGRRRSRRRIDLANNGRRFRPRFCTTGGNMALYGSARAPRAGAPRAPRGHRLPRRISSVLPEKRSRTDRRPENRKKSFTVVRPGPVGRGETVR